MWWGKKFGSFWSSKQWDEAPLPLYRLENRRLKGSLCIGQRLSLLLCSATSKAKCNKRKRLFFYFLISWLRKKYFPSSNNRSNSEHVSKDLLRRPILSMEDFGEFVHKTRFSCKVRWLQAWIHCNTTLSRHVLFPPTKMQKLRFQIIWCPPVGGRMTFNAKEKLQR